MANALYMDDSYLSEFDALVISVKEKSVILDRTAFFPQGGGVECDLGIIESQGKQYNVVKVWKSEGEIIHEVEIEGLRPGDKVHCVLNWERRYKLMRCHTGTHVLCGVFSRDYNLL